jgi:hypothetical protein
MTTLHPRFHQPMTPDLLDELSAYRDIYDSEVSRVVRVLGSWPVCGVLGRIKVKPKVRRLKSVAA